MQNNFTKRLKTIRKSKGLSQAKLAGLVGVHVTQISRYERGDTKPNADAMGKIAQALETTTDFLMNGTTDDIVRNAGLDKEIISRFKQIQNFNYNEKKTALYLLDAIIAKSKMREIFQQQLTS